MASSSLDLKPPCPISHVLETCIYVKSLPDATTFYTKTLGLKPDFMSESMACYPLGRTTLLLFALGETLDDIRPDPSKPQNMIPKHGPNCELVDILIKDWKQLRQHFCLAVANKDDALRWEQFLQKKKVPVVGRNDWQRGGYSVYFQDPDGNIGEIASRGIWPHY